LTDAVIAKAASNDSIEAYNEPLNRYLFEDAGTESRLLIVRALARDPNNGKPSFAIGYTTTAGSSLDVQSRFLEALGTTPFKTN